MNRKQRLQSRKSSRISRLNRCAAVLEASISKAGIPHSELAPFTNWMLSTLWHQYKTERMNQRISIENEIRNLGLRFPNGTVNKPYHVEFYLPLDKISHVFLQDTDELGFEMLINPDGKCEVNGIVHAAGDYCFKLKFKTIEGEPESEIVIPVAFNPNPRDLWKNIPTDKNVVFYKPDSASEYVKVVASEDGSPKKDIVVASQRGRSHANDGRARDDHFSVHYCNESDWYILAVADGAGSAKFSRKGSEVACNVAMEHCKKFLIDNKEFENAIFEYQADRDNQSKRTLVTRHVISLVYNGAMRAHDALKKAAAANDGASLKDFATTLMLAVCKKYDFGWFVASFWVGDGAMCLLDTKRKTAKLLGTPDEGEFSGQTRFLTMPEIFKDRDAVSKRVRMSIVPDFTALLMMTDGVSDPMFETERNLSDYSKWEEFYNSLRTGFPEDDIDGVVLEDDNDNAEAQLLKWLDFWSTGNHDDRTIAILY